MHQPVQTLRTQDELTLVFAMLKRTVAPRRCWGVRARASAEPAGSCMVRGCGNPAVGRVRLNVWGTVCEIESCREHLRLDCHWVDDF